MSFGVSFAELIEENAYFKLITSWCYRFEKVWYEILHRF